MVKGADATLCWAWSRPSWKLCERTWLISLSKRKNTALGAKSWLYGAAREGQLEGFKHYSSNAFSCLRITETGRSTQKRCWNIKLRNLGRTKNDSCCRLGSRNTWLGSRRKIKRSSNVLLNLKFKTLAPATAKRLTCLDESSKKRTESLSKETSKKPICKIIWRKLSCVEFVL